jgi:hypothetical protein
LVRHADVVGIGVEVLRGGHDGELDGALVAKGLVGPFSDGADLLDGSNAVIGDEHLMSRRGKKWSARFSRLQFLAAVHNSKAVIPTINYQKRKMGFQVNLSGQ